MKWQHISLPVDSGPQLSSPISDNLNPVQAKFSLNTQKHVTHAAISYNSPVYDHEIL